MTFDYRISVYNQLVNQGAQQKVKQLDQQERKEVLVALKALQTEEPSGSTLQSEKLQSIAEKLEKLPSATSSPRSFFLISFFKGLFNLMFRLSSDSLFNEAAKVTAMKNELKDRIPSLIEQKEKEIAEWNEMIRFNKEDAAPLYQEITDFYSSLLENLHEAFQPLNEKYVAVSSIVEEAKAKKSDSGKFIIPEDDHEKITALHGSLLKKLTEISQKLNKKFEEVSSRVEAAKFEKKDTGYIKILEKEILASLRKLKNYKTDFKKESFAMELTGNINAFSNGLKLAIDPKNYELAKLDIAKLNEEIATLKTRKGELENLPLAQLSG